MKPAESKAKAPIVVTLRERVYDYLKAQLNDGKLKPGAFLDLASIGEDLGLSRTPLRDALLRLEAEGFVTIHQRRGVVVNVLDVSTIRNAYQIIGALESSAVMEASSSIGPRDLDAMSGYDEAMQQALENGDFDAYYRNNVAFHSVFLDRSSNTILRSTVNNLKERLYDFPRRSGYLRDWEQASINEHKRLVELMRVGRFRDAALYLRDVHWSYIEQERFVMAYYFAPEQEAAVETDAQ